MGINYSKEIKYILSNLKIAAQEQSQLKCKEINAVKSILISQLYQGEKEESTNYINIKSIIKCEVEENLFKLLDLRAHLSYLTVDNINIGLRSNHYKSTLFILSYLDYNKLLMDKLKNIYIRIKEITIEKEGEKFLNEYSFTCKDKKADKLIKRYMKLKDNSLPVKEYHDKLIDFRKKNGIKGEGYYNNNHTNEDSILEDLYHDTEYFGDDNCQDDNVSTIDVNDVYVIKEIENEYDNSDDDKSVLRYERNFNFRDVEGLSEVKNEYINIKKQESLENDKLTINNLIKRVDHKIIYNSKNNSKTNILNLKNESNTNKIINNKDNTSEKEIEDKKFSSNNSIIDNKSPFTMVINSSLNKKNLNDNKAINIKNKTEDNIRYSIYKDIDKIKETPENIFSKNSKQSQILNEFNNKKKYNEINKSFNLENNCDNKNNKLNNINTNTNTNYKNLMKNKIVSPNKLTYTLNKSTINKNNRLKENSNLNNENKNILNFVKLKNFSLNSHATTNNNNITKQLKCNYTTGSNILKNDKYASNSQHNSPLRKNKKSNTNLSCNFESLNDYNNIEYNKIIINYKLITTVDRTNVNIKDIRSNANSTVDNTKESISSLKGSFTGQNNKAEESFLVDRLKQNKYDANNNLTTHNSLKFHNSQLSTSKSIDNLNTNNKLFKKTNLHKNNDNKNIISSSNAQYLNTHKFYNKQNSLNSSSLIDFTLIPNNYNCTLALCKEIFNYVNKLRSNFLSVYEKLLLFKTKLLTSDIVSLYNYNKQSIVIKNPFSTIEVERIFHKLEDLAINIKNKQLKKLENLKWIESIFNNIQNRDTKPTDNNYPLLVNSLINDSKINSIKVYKINELFEMNWNFMLLIMHDGFINDLLFDVPKIYNYCVVNIFLNKITNKLEYFLVLIDLNNN